MPVAVAGGTSSPAQFNQFISLVEDKAKAYGIGPKGIEALKQSKFLPKVIEKDRNQGEFKLTLTQYLDRIMRSKRVSTGRRLYQQERALLQDIDQSYGVDPSILLALWGIESNFGDYKGSFPVIDSVATLAFEGRRRKFFTDQLLAALQIIEDGHIVSSKMLGSWAGAMGQMQFIPTTFAQYAVDYNGDGRRDIWHNRGDALASAANYLKNSGWNTGDKWGVEIDCKQAPDNKLAKKNSLWWRTKDYWSKRIDGLEGRLPGDGQWAFTVIGSDADKRCFMVGKNFATLLHWNRSRFFALAVTLLAEKISLQDP